MRIAMHEHESVDCGNQIRPFTQIYLDFLLKVAA